MVLVPRYATTECGHTTTIKYNDSEPKSRPLLGIEHHRPHLNRLPQRRIRRTRLVRKRRMQRKPRLVHIRIKALEERHLVRRLVRKVIPLVSRTVPETVRARLTVRVDESRRHQVLL